jgi:hypothetical protein
VRAFLFACVLAVLAGAAAAQQCRQAKFAGRVDAGDNFTQALGDTLEFRIRGEKGEDSGWELSVNPRGSDDDWAYVVTPPLRSGNAEYMANGYGQTVREQLARPHEITFVLDEVTYQRMSKLADDALWPYNAKDPDNAASAYFNALHDATTGLLVLKATDYDKLGASDQARWMQFEATVTVPKTFAVSDELHWIAVKCPAPAQ